MARERPGSSAYCRRFRWIHGESLFTWEEALGPASVPWVDEAGMPRIELRLAAGLVRHIEELCARNFLATDPESFPGPNRAPRADRLLGRVWREIDDPFLRLLAEWSKPATRVTVAYPPEEPARAVPVELREDEATGWSRVGDLAGWSLGIPLGLFGLLAWGAGSYLLTGGSRWATVALVLAGVPGVLLVGGPTDPGGVLRHGVDQVSSQATALPERELADLLTWAASVQERGGGEEIGLLFVDAALELQDDPSRSREVRWRAERILHALARHEPSTNPYRLAVAERRRILDRVPRP